LDVANHIAQITPDLGQTGRMAGGDSLKAAVDLSRQGGHP
jgi:hypothetical protein